MFTERKYSIAAHLPPCIPARLRQGFPPPGSGPAGRPADAPRAAEAPDKGSLLCRRCRRIVTHQRERIQQDGAHHHTFANPHGIVFEIGCFAAAPGCRPSGAPSVEFSWFAAYQWQVAVCSGCRLHLGWRFSAPSRPAFHGLILDHLVGVDD